VYFNDTSVALVPDSTVSDRVETAEAYVLMYRLRGTDRHARAELAASVGAEVAATGEEQQNDAQLLPQEPGNPSLSGPVLRRRPQASLAAQ
jgi:hypothetical protein